MEELIRHVLLEQITYPLATFNNVPAIFYQQAPADAVDGWSDVQYPRMDFNTTMDYNSEFGECGKLFVNVYCLNEGDVEPDDIAAQTQGILSGLFLTPEGAAGASPRPTYALIWDNTQNFAIEKSREKEKEPRIIGNTLTFDVYAFPTPAEIMQTPVFSVNRYIKDLLPNSVVIGYDGDISQILKPTDDNPVIYTRLTNESKGEVYYTVAWLIGTLKVHVIAPSFEQQENIVWQIVRQLSIDAQLFMKDNSFMYIQGVQNNTVNNAVKSGQITIKGKYGLLRPESDAEILDDIANQWRDTSIVVQRGENYGEE